MNRLLDLPIKTEAPSATYNNCSFVTDNSVRVSLTTTNNYGSSAKQRPVWHEPVGTFIGMAAITGLALYALHLLGGVFQFLEHWIL